MTKPVAEFAQSHQRPPSAANRSKRERNRVVVHCLPFDAQLFKRVHRGLLSLVVV